MAHDRVIQQVDYEIATRVIQQVDYELTTE